MRVIAALVPALQPVVRNLLDFANGGGCGPGITALIGRTLASADEQAAIYAMGRTAPGRYLHRPGGVVCDEATCVLCATGGLGHKVTQAPAGSSYHEYGRACDFVLLEWGKVTKSTDETDDPAWQAFGRRVMEMAETVPGLCWGGNWSRQDGAHVELHPAGLGCRDAWRLGEKQATT